MKNTKKSLLTSALCLLLCMSMLVGTTFAWFTDEVTSGKNQIIAGNLDVELEYAKVVNGQIAAWAPVAGETEIFDPNALWEPGHTEVVYLKVSNLGTLALKYQLGVNVISETPSINVNDEAFKLSEHLVFKAVELPDALTTYSDREVAQLTAGTEKGLKDYNGKTTKLEVGGEDYVALIVYMPETVGNEANYKTGAAVPTIELGINLFATQKDAESDSFGPNYDEFAGLPWNGETVTENLTADADGVYHITCAADLVAMMNDSKYPNCNKYKNVVLECDINLGGKTVSGFGDERGFFDGIFDGQGYTISNFKIDATNRPYYAGLFNQVSQHIGENTVIKNLTVADSTIKGTSQVGAIVGGMNGNTVVENCKVINCDLYATKKVGSVVGYTAGGTVKDCYAENCTVLYSEKEGGEVLGYENTGSTVSDNTFKDVTVKKATVITTAEELLALGGKSLEGTYEIMADIDLKDAAMPTIGAAYGKTLTINGNDHTISNATTAHTNHNNMKHHGFFYAYTDSTLSISNLTFKNIVIDATKDTERNYGAGIIVAYADCGSIVNLTNVDVKNSKVLNNTPDIGDEAGVYVGYQTGTLNMVDCDSTGCVVAGETAEKTGAFIGMVNGNATLTNCTTDLTIGACNRISGTLVINGAVVVANAEALKAVNGGNVALTGTVDLGGTQGSYLTLTNNTTITGGTIKGTGWTGEMNYAVNASSGNIVFDGVTFDTTNWSTVGWANWGISVNVNGTANVTFKNCTFKGAQCPIYQSGADAVVTLENCTFTGGCIQCEIYSGDFQLGQDLIVKNCNFTGMADVLHIYDYDKDPTSDAIVQYLTSNGNTFTGTCKQTCK